MVKLQWDQLGDKIYQTGLDRGVLYPPNADGVPWNGLTSIKETHPEDKITPLYLNGVKYFDHVFVGDFQATLSAFTYPDEFEQFDGSVEFSPGVYLSRQIPGQFSLSYRTIVGNDVDGQEYGYKIHIFYNLTAVSSDKTHTTMSQNSTLEEFSWTIYGVPEIIEGYAPTAHLIIRSTDLHPLQLEQLEDVLYGTETSEPHLPSLAELTYMLEYVIRIVDHGDGTWSAIGPEDYIIDNGDGSFEIREVNAVTISADTYEISSTSA